MIKMKKTYDKPRLFCEELHPETMLCGCDVKNPTWSDIEMCAYELTISNSTFRIFSNGWDGACDMNNEYFKDTEYYMCYWGPVTSIFSS
ncbi:MAG: hypothetical protein IKM59_02860 [Oscillospiraceae bacterium]|nr:hypothetical protein [Oscillospiraceae bacterium]